MKIIFHAFHSGKSFRNVNDLQDYAAHQLDSWSDFFTPLSLSSTKKEQVISSWNWLKSTKGDQNAINQYLISKPAIIFNSSLGSHFCYLIKLQSESQFSRSYSMLSRNSNPHLNLDQRTFVDCAQIVATATYEQGPFAKIKQKTLASIIDDLEARFQTVLERDQSKLDERDHKYTILDEKIDEKIHAAEAKSADYLYNIKQEWNTLRDQFEDQLQTSTAVKLWQDRYNEHKKAIIFSEIIV